jgi:hypothetical protein
MHYTCPRCGYITETSQNLIKHLIRQTTCIPILLDIDVDKINIGECKVVDDNYKCIGCDKSFSTNGNLVRHMRICKGDIIIKLIKQISDKDKIINELSKKIDVITNNNINTSTTNSTSTINNNNNPVTINNNITVNLNINPIILFSYKNPKIDHLTNDDYFECIRSITLAVPNLLKKIYFNPNVPENHSIYIANINKNFANMYNGKIWELVSKDELIDTIIQDLERKLENWAEDEINQANYKNKKLTSYRGEYDRKKQSNFNNFNEAIIKEVMLELYNRKDMPLEIRKKMKKQLAEKLKLQ